MASTYSTNLKIELMALGDQAGTWGTTTNTNILRRAGAGDSGLRQSEFHLRMLISRSP
jgi:hypothetical protein